MTSIKGNKKYFKMNTNKQRKVKSFHVKTLCIIWGGNYKLM